MSRLPELDMRDACATLGFEVPQIVATDGWRWTLAEYPGLGPKMIKLERRLQEMTGRPIDLRLEPLKDKNKRKERNVLSERVGT